MRLGIMQPYFLPYFEHFRLINACDKWVVFDIAQFTRKSFISRNRILNKDTGTAYISVPVKHVGTTLRIADAEIDYTSDWQKRFFDQLRIYKQQAPHYDVIVEFLAPIFIRRHRTISQLNVDLLLAICSKLNITTQFVNCSSLAVPFPEECGPGEWALHIAKFLGATEYRNPSGGRALFDQCQFDDAGIKLSFHEHGTFDYSVGSFGFVHDLSIIDYLMWNGVPKLKSWL